mmetsp:Transcript_6287/g.18057  ORF Transcript_6287/g.18057 Transcript_6287/m.18057 type:complete len:221 (-) Transcript_6287:551-1213(-)
MSPRPWRRSARESPRGRSGPRPPRKPASPCGSCGGIAPLKLAALGAPSRRLPHPRRPVRCCRALRPPWPRPRGLAPAPSSPAAAPLRRRQLWRTSPRRRPPPQLPRRRWHSWRLWRGARKRTRRRPPPTRPLPRRLPRSCCRPPPPRIRRVGGCTCLPLQHRTTAKRRAALRLRRSRVLRGGARPTTPQASCCWEASPRRALLQDPPRSAEDSWRRCCAT